MGRAAKQTHAMGEGEASSMAEAIAAVKRLVRAEIEKVKIWTEHHIEVSTATLPFNLLRSTREELRLLVTNAKADLLAELRQTLKADVHAVVKEQSKIRIEIKTGASPKVQVRAVSPPVHECFEKALQTVTARTSDNLPVPPLFVGPKGSGKSRLAGQLADAVGVPLFPVACGPTLTEAKLLGFQNLVSGTFVPGLLFEPYVNGGLIFFDEVDAADPEVLVAINGLICGHTFRFPDGVTVRRHKECYVAAGANTSGSGAANGYTRHKLDAAFLDRFARIDVGYDYALERLLVQDQEWLALCQEIRERGAHYVPNHSIVSTRQIIYGEALLRNGRQMIEVVKELLLRDLPESHQKSICNSIRRLLR